MNLIKEFLLEYHLQLIVSIIILMIDPIIRMIIKKLILKYSLLKSKVTEARTRVILKYFNFLINFIVIIILITIWGVNPKNIFIAFSSIFAIIGVAFFAQWSLLSNITAGIIIYFNAPFRIGSLIKILDKDFPVEGSIVDIRAFYIYIQTAEGKLIVYPNNLILQKGVAILNKDNE